MSVIIDLSIFPIGKGESVSQNVALAVGVIRESGLTHQTHAMGTLIEGDLDDVMGVVQRCFTAMTEASDRVYMTVKADYRKGPLGRMNGKLRFGRRHGQDVGTKETHGYRKKLGPI